MPPQKLSLSVVALDPVGDFEDVVLFVFIACGEEVFKHAGEDLQAVSAVADIVHDAGILAGVYYEEAFE